MSPDVLTAAPKGLTFYDHLAGRLGVGITDTLLARIGVDLGAARERRRAFALACSDWTSAART